MPTLGEVGEFLFALIMTLQGPQGGTAVMSLFALWAGYRAWTASRRTLADLDICIAARAAALEASHAHELTIARMYGIVSVLASRLGIDAPPLDELLNPESAAHFPAPRSLPK